MLKLSLILLFCRKGIFAAKTTKEFTIVLQDKNIAENIDCDEKTLEINTFISLYADDPTFLR